MKILILSRYSTNGASSRQRFFQYLPFLEKANIETKVAPFFNESYLYSLYSGKRESITVIMYYYFRRLFVLLSIYKYDLIWIQYEILPWFPAFPERILYLLNRHFLVDYDDAVFHSYDQSGSFIIRKILGNKIEQVMKKASGVIVGNKYLKLYARRSNAKNIYYLPTVVDMAKYPFNPQTKENVLKIVWIGTKTTVKYLNFLNDVLPDIVDSGRNIILYIIGPNKSDLKNIPLEFINWSEKSEGENISRFDVGIMPLPDEPFERGKCGYKLIQYMACGLPVIASPVGANQTIVDHNNNGILASTTEEWKTALRYLNDNPDIRKRMGHNGRKKITKTYSLHFAAKQLESIISNFR